MTKFFKEIPDSLSVPFRETENILKIFWPIILEFSFVALSGGYQNIHWIMRVIAILIFCFLISVGLINWHRLMISGETIENIWSAFTPKAQFINYFLYLTSIFIFFIIFQLINFLTLFAAIDILLQASMSLSSKEIVSSGITSGHGRVFISLFFAALFALSYGTFLSVILIRKIVLELPAIATNRIHSKEEKGRINTIIHGIKWPLALSLCFFAPALVTFGAAFIFLLFFGFHPLLLKYVWQVIFFWQLVSCATFLSLVYKNEIRPSLDRAHHQEHPEAQGN